MRDITYPVVIGAAKTAFKLLKQDVRLSGTENVPTSGGFLLVSNHVGYADFVYAGLAAHPAKRLVRFMAKKEIFDTPVAGQLMRSMHHIPVNRGDGLESYRRAVTLLRQGEAVGIFPEATISRAMELKEFKSGAVRMAQEAGVPILPVIVWGTQRIFPKGHPRDFTRGRTISIRAGELITPTDEDATSQTEALRATMSAMLDEVIASHPAAEQPPGSWWLPAKHGGGAPTLEEAAEIDRQYIREKARQRAAKRAGKR